MRRFRNSWLLPAPELVSRASQYTRLLHRVIAISGLTLGGGGYVLDLLGLTTGFLDARGTMLGFVLGFSLLAIAPLSLVSLLTESRIWQVLIQNLLVWVFIGVLWFTEEMDWLVTTTFLCYALTVLAIWVSTRGKGEMGGRS